MHFNIDSLSDDTVVDRQFNLSVLYQVVEYQYKSIPRTVKFMSSYMVTCTLNGVSYGNSNLSIKNTKICSNTLQIKIDINTKIII